MAADLQQLGPYQLVEPLGKGGMATVYMGYHRALERYVAIKVLPLHLAAEPGFRERFHREAVAIARLRHPNILTVYDHGQEGEHAYIVTELFTGGSLADWLGRQLPVETVTGLLAPIADALDYAHRQGVVHRDVKPSNVLLASDGTPVLADFGLARSLLDGGTRLTVADSVLGTPQYMSPEQCRGEPVTPASDQYSLGMVAYEMLTGSVPFRAETPAGILVAQITEVPPPPRSVNPGVPAPVDQALIRSLAKAPTDRFPTCASLVAAMTPPPAVATPGPATPFPTVAQPQPPPGRSSRLLWLPGLALIILLLAITGLWQGIPRLGRLAAHSPTSTPSPATSPDVSPIPSSGATPARGAPIFQAKLHGSTDDLREVRPSGTQQVKLGEDLEMTVEAGDTTGAQFNMRSVSDYVGELEVATVPPGEFDFNWILRQEQSRAILLSLTPASDTMTLFRINDDQTMDALTPAIPAPGAHDGHRITLSVVVQQSRYQVYLNGEQVADATDQADSPLTAALVPWVSVDQGHGTIKISAVRYFEIP